MTAVEESSKKPHRVIGYWMSDKKTKKLNWSDFGDVCRNYGFHLVKLDLTKPLEEQGPFTVILHKMSMLFTGTDEESVSMVQRVEEYIREHPKVIVIDPLDNVRNILNRYDSYSAIPGHALEKYDVFIPSFVELTSTDTAENLKKLKAANVTFPFVCKPLAPVSITNHQYHTMALIFNEQNLADCQPPCVAQSFVNHNAVLFKLYIVGDEYQLVERPSLKNFQPSASEASIFFLSHDVSKPNCTSSLSILDEEEALLESPSLDKTRINALVSIAKQELGLSLFGIDLIVTNDTGKYGLIDVNVFPGYEGFPDFFETLIKYISKLVTEQESIEKASGDLAWSSSSFSPTRRYSYRSCENSDHSETVSPMDSDNKFIHPNPSHVVSRNQDDSGFDTSDSSDEKKYKYQSTPNTNLRSSSVSKTVPHSSITCSNSSKNRDAKKS